jgi:hypothetical protein
MLPTAPPIVGAATTATTKKSTRKRSRVNHGEVAK